MKIIKKIAAIMLSVMMVLGMCSVVGAEGTGTTSGTGTSGITGSITINNAAPGETYNIYRILDLESYSGSGKAGNYAYKLRTYDSGSIYNWRTFINQDEISGTSGYVTIDGEYVTWKEGASVEKFAKAALAYAKDSTTKIDPDKTKTLSNSEASATFSDLPLGYYLVETSMGTVLALNTTNPNQAISEKNTAPTVEKKVSNASDGNYGDTSTASIGDPVYFKTTIHAKKGAQNYVLHDTMSEGLTFDKKSIEVKKDTTTKLNTPSDYKLVTDSMSDNCTFEIEFTKDFCNSITADTDIIVTYSATLNEKAVIGSTTGNTNKTHLSYGDKGKTTEVTTTTYTFEVPVFKFTKLKDASATKKGLANAEFTLSTDANGTKLISLVDITTTSTTDKTYRVETGTASTGTSTITTVTTPDSGKFKIQGLAAGTYYLTETKQPDGYNKLSAPVKITIDINGNITVGESASSSVTEVEVENKTGSLLPSTGGMGTTLFYIFGAILVIGSGVVLITKKRMK